MRPRQAKQVVVRYVDKCVLVALGILLLLALRQLWRRDERVVKLKEDINAGAARLKRNLDESAPPKLRPLNYAQMLSDRFAHIPVIEPYNRYVLQPPEPISLGTVRLVLNQPTTLEIPQVQILGPTTWDKDVLKVGPVAPMDEKDLGKGTKVTLTPLKVTYQTSREVSKLQLKDTDDQRYNMEVIVYEKVPEKRPYAPREPSIVVVTGRVLIVAQLDNPEPLPRIVARGAGIEVHRKRAGRPDSEYENLTDKQPAVPDRDYRERVRQLLFEAAQGTWTGAEVSGKGRTDKEGVINAPVVDWDEERAQRWRSGRGAAPGLVDLEKDLVWYLDETTLPGEKYVYRVFSVTEPISQKRVSSDPWVSDVITVPSDVEFRLTNVRGDTAIVKVWKLDYKLNTWHDQTFQVTPGMKIGQKVTKRVMIDTPQGAKRENLDVDFFTGCTLVAAFESQPMLRTNMGWRPSVDDKGRPTTVLTATVLERSEPMMVVQTRQGGLECYYREKEPARVHTRPLAGAPGLEAVQPTRVPARGPVAPTREPVAPRTGGPRSEEPTIDYR